MALGFGHGAGTWVEAQPHIRNGSTYSNILGKLFTVLILSVLNESRIFRLLHSRGRGLNRSDLRLVHLAFLHSAMLEVDTDTEDRKDGNDRSNQADLESGEHHFSGTSVGGTVTGATASLSFVTR